MKVKLNELKIIDDIYPRVKKSPKKIEEYVENLLAGEELHTILIQRVLNGEEEILANIDGYHRKEAYKLFNEKIKDFDGEFAPIEEVECIEWQEGVVLDLQNKEDKKQLLLKVTNANRKHGLRLTYDDLEQQALRLVELDPTIENKEIAKEFGVTEKTVSKWVSSLRNKYQTSRNAIIYRLSFLGWTQKEIADYIEGISGQSTVSEIIGELTEVKSAIQNEFYKNKKPIEELSKFYKLDVTLLWALILEEKNDLERFSLFGESQYQDDAPKVYNVWNFTGCDPRLGQKHPGQIPGQIMLNVLYRYTQQGDLVVDPMAGGGSTVDACLVMGRKCRAYDINSVRQDIIEWDLCKGFPEFKKQPQLIFLDPPYWNLMAEFYPDGSISDASLDDWLKFMENTITECYETVCNDGHVALILEAMVDEGDTKEFYDLPFLCMNFFENVGFKEEHRISVPLSTQVKSGRDVNFAKKKNILLSINRDLIVYKKV